MIYITHLCDFTLRFNAKRVGFNRYVKVSFAEIADAIVKLINMPATKTPVSYTIDELGRLVVPIDGSSLVCNTYGIEITGFYNNGNWRYQLAPAFEIVNESTEDNYALNENDNLVIDLDIILGETYVSSRVFDNEVQKINKAAQDITQLQEDVANAGKVDDVKVNGVSVVSSKEANISIPTKVSDLQNDSEFVTETELEEALEEAGHVDDVKVNGVSVVSNKNANINVPTVLSDLQNDCNFPDRSEIPGDLADLQGDSTHRTVTDAEKAAWNNKQDAITNVSMEIEEDGGEPDGSAEMENGELKLTLKNMRMKFSDLTAEEKAQLKGEPGDSVIVGQGDLPLADKLGDSSAKAITQKTVTDSLQTEGLAIYPSAYLPVAKKYLDANNSWATSNNMGCTLIPVTVGDVIKITANSTTYTAYAFLTSGETTGDNLVDGTARTVISANGTKTFEIPATCTHLYLTTTASGNDATPKLMKMVNIKNKTNNTGTGVVKEIPLVIEETKNGYIDGTTGKWKSGADSNQYAIIPIIGGKTYVITPYTSGTVISCAFLTDKTLTNGVTPSYAGGHTNRMQFSGSKVRVKAPSEANYFIYYSKYQGNDRTLSFFGIEETWQEAVEALPKEINKEKTIGLKLQMRRFASPTTGDYAAATSNHLFSTPKMYVRPVDGVVKMKITADGTAHILGYDSERKYTKEITGIAVTKNTEFTVNLNSDFAFFKLEFNATAVATDVYPDLVYAQFTGYFPENCEKYNHTQRNADANGNWMIPLTIAVDTPDPFAQDEETSVVADTVNIQFDHGILALPSTYTADGEPTRLIIFCHGAGKHIGSNATSFPSGDYGIDPNYWLSEGYAVMDMDGMPDTVEDLHWCLPIAYQCYLAAYKFVIDNYNLRKDGVFLGGRSLGGGMALTIMSYSDIPVLACCPFAPYFPDIINSFYRQGAASKKEIADALGIVNPDNIAWPAANESLQSVVPVLTLETITDGNNNERYIGNFGRFMQRNPAYRMCVNNPAPSAFLQAKIWQAEREDVFNLYKDCAIKTLIPTKFFGAYDDTTIAPFWVNLWVRMFRNGGCTVEQRMFASGNHPFDLASANLVSSFINSKGVTLSNVSIAYIEALQFWRRYE